eukprot:gene4908-6871_t
MQAESCYNEKFMRALTDLAKQSNPTRVDLSNCELNSFPIELFAYKDSLEFLNFGNNNLSALPESLNDFTKLKILFFSNNKFTKIPSGAFDKLNSLYMVSFKSNLLCGELEVEGTIPPSVSWLILTDNRITGISNINKLPLLRKVMLSGNLLTDLPIEMAQCTDIELLRLSGNKLSHLPSWLITLPKLSWLAYAGNLFDVGVDTIQSELKVDHIENTSLSNDIDWNRISLKDKLGEGASGTVYQASMKGSETVFTNVYAISESTFSNNVAVKIFKGQMTSDGLPENEVKATEASGTHPNLIGVIGRLVNTPNCELGVVLPLISSDYQILGQPPSFESITRDTYSNNKYSLDFIIKLLLGISSACNHIHHIANIIHGDVYAHNILCNDQGHALLTDFGAASFKSSIQQPLTNDLEENVWKELLEKIEVRAFACLMEDMILRLDDSIENNYNSNSAYLKKQRLYELMDRCFNPIVHSRPFFNEIYEVLAMIQ